LRVGDERCDKSKQLTPRREGTKKRKALVLAFFASFAALRETNFGALRTADGLKGLLSGGAAELLI